MLFRSLALTLPITLGACTAHFAQPSCIGPIDGIALATWTLRGQPASAASCAGIDHLALTIFSNQCSGAATIEPIPCAAGRIRYDNLPRGPGTLELDALDARGVTIASGMAPFDLEPNPNVTPAPIDLR